MKPSFSWKRGLLGGFIVLVVGISIFVFSSHRTNNACTAGATTCNDTPHPSIFQPYADFWLSAFAPECVGGNAPDDCIGPNILIMAGTLFVSGFVVGGLIHWKRKKAVV